jgi:hypothetical protein
LFWLSGLGWVNKGAVSSVDVEPRLCVSRPVWPCQSVE